MFLASAVAKINKHKSYLCRKNVKIHLKWLPTWQSCDWGEVLCNSYVTGLTKPFCFLRLLDVWEGEGGGRPPLIKVRAEEWDGDWGTGQVGREREFSIGPVSARRHTGRGGGGGEGHYVFGIKGSWVNQGEVSSFQRMCTGFNSNPHFRRWYTHVRIYILKTWHCVSCSMEMNRTFQKEIIDTLNGILWQLYVSMVTLVHRLNCLLHGSTAHFNWKIVTCLGKETSA